MRPGPHPFAFNDKKTGALGIESGSRIRRKRDGMIGIADEFLHDGEVFCSWNDGTFSTEKWTGVEGITEDKK